MLLSSIATMEHVFQKFGFVTKKMIVEITVMNWKCANLIIVPVILIYLSVTMEDAYRLAGNVMAKLIVQKKKMNQRAAQKSSTTNVNHPTSGASQEDAYLEDGNVTMIMTVGMDLMKMIVLMKNIDYAQRMKSSVTMVNVYTVVNGVMAMMIAALMIELMKCFVISNVMLKNSGATIHLIAFMRNGNVMVRGIVQMEVMRKTVHSQFAVQENFHAKHSSTLVPLASVMHQRNALILSGNVMGNKIVLMAVMRIPKLVKIGSVRATGSDVITTFVYFGVLCVMAQKTVQMDPMKRNKLA